jgi:hypothetical protein
LNPFLSAFPEISSITNLQADATQDFIGMKIGDATDCINDVHNPAFLTLSASSAAANNGQSVVVNITTQGFLDVAGLQFSMSWSPAVAQLDQVNDGALANFIAPGTYHATAGQVSFCWADPSTNGATLPDGSVLFSLQFTLVGAGGSSTPLAFGDTPTRREVVDDDCLPYDLNTNNGSLTVLGGGGSCILACNDLIFVQLNDDCEATIEPLDILAESPTGCAGPLLLEVRDASNTILLTNVTSAVLTPSMGSTLLVAVKDQASGNLCWGQITLQGDCDATLCDSISVSASDSVDCCHILTINNLKPEFFQAAEVCVLSGGQVGSASGLNGWALQNPGAVSSAVFLPTNGNPIAVGSQQFATLCLENLTADSQVVEVKYYGENFQVLCRDTLVLRCDACVQAIVDSVYCERWGVYKMDFCVQTGSALDWTAGSVQVIPLGGVIFDQTAFSLPDVPPGTLHCDPSLQVTVSNVSPGQTVCFYAIIHEQDIAVGEPDLVCCSDTVPVCFVVPMCDPCDSTVTYAEAAVVPDEACCWKITLHNPPDEFVGISTEITTPGVAFSLLDNFLGSGWFLSGSVPSTYAYWDAIPPQGNFVQDGYMLRKVCIADDGSGTATTPQTLVVTWHAADGSTCSDELLLDCDLTPESDCVSLDSNLVTCNADGTYTLTFTVKNETASTTADQVHLTPDGPVPFTISPDDFFVNLPPGATSPPLTATLSGAPSAVYYFLITLHEINDDSLHLNCCTDRDSVVLQLADDTPPTCTAPPGVEVSCADFELGGDYGSAVGTDDCCFAGITVSDDGSQLAACNGGTVVRTFMATDCAGNTAICTQIIVVIAGQSDGYFIQFPDDQLITSCDGTNNYGAPQFGDIGCELIATAYTDEVNFVVPDACYQINRTWRIINWCTFDPSQPCVSVPNPRPANPANNPANLPGPVVSPSGTLTPWAPSVVAITPGALPTDYSTFWNIGGACYEYVQIIKVVDNDPPQVTNCPTATVPICDESDNDGQLWNESYWLDPLSGSNDICEDGVNFEITTTDLCGGANLSFRYLLFLDLDQNGTQETVVNSDNLPGYNNVQFDNAGNVGYLGGTPRSFDERPVPTNEKWGFGIQIDAPLGINRNARVRWFNQIGQESAPQFPHGTHRIKWFVADICGNETVCEYTFTVQDCQAPSIACVNPLIASLSGNPPAITVWYTDPLAFATDNCTPSNLLQFGIQALGASTSFPTQQSMTFDCADLGLQEVEIWSADLAGNSTFCVTTILVTDPFNLCAPFTSPGFESFRLFQNQPNPWNAQTAIPFYLPEASEARLVIFDEMGRPLHDQTGYFERGNQQFLLNGPVSNSSSNLYYRVTTPTASGTMRMVQIKN